MFDEQIHPQARRPRRRILTLGASCAALLAGVHLAAAVAAAGETVRVSVGTGDVQSNDESDVHVFGGMSARGTVIAFESAATGLVVEDSNDASDVFVRDVKRKTLTRVSVATGGAQADGYSGGATVSSNGSFVAFLSDATNLVADDTNGARDVFLRDAKMGVTTRVSINSAGIQGDLPSGGSGFLAVSGNGGSVVYSSSASNLVPADTNATEDIFHHDVKKRLTTRVSVAADGSEANDYSFGPSPSSNGQIVAFVSGATNLVSGDRNGTSDVFVRDARRGTTRRVSVASDGSEGNGGCGIPSISSNGRYVAFVSVASNLVPGDTNGEADAFVHDVKTGLTRRVSIASDGAQGNARSAEVAISSNGRFVIFGSAASNLVAADTNGVKDVFVHDRKTGITVRANVDGAGVQSTGAVGSGLGITSNGRRALFASDAPGLVLGDSNGVRDVFFHDLR